MGIRLTNGVSRRTVLVGGLASAAGLTALGGVADRADAAITMPSRASTVARFGALRPSYWGMWAPGVISGFPTSTAAGADAVCLSFDACGGSVLRYDAALIALLRQHQVPATLFINKLWAQHNAAIFASLLKDPLFEIGNHGVRHLPLSVSGRSAYGIAGTRNVGEIYDEVAGCHEYMLSSWRYSPRFMRTGTAYTDDVAPKVVSSMTERLVSFSVNGDAGATYPAGTVYTEVCKARPGDIVISHMNHPGGGTYPGYARAIPAMKARGLKFRTLSQVLGAAAPLTRWATVAEGSRGTEVVQVQHVIRVSADGVFGPITKDAVVLYQRAHHLVPDGIVGPLTAHAMHLA